MAYKESNYMDSSELTQRIVLDAGKTDGYVRGRKMVINATSGTATCKLSSPLVVSLCISAVCSCVKVSVPKASMRGEECERCA